MALSLKLQPKLTQQLVLTPQLQLSIKILQLNHLELTDVISQELQENPVLEIKDNLNGKAENETDFEFEKFLDNYSKINEEYFEKERFYSQKDLNEDDEESSNILDIYSAKRSNLYDHLLWQLNLEKLTDEEIRIGEEIIGNIDSDGYLRVDIKDISESLNTSEDNVYAVLKKIQKFDPVGIASRNLKECLLNQIEVYGAPTPYIIPIIENHLEDLAKKSFKKISKELNITEEEVKLALDFISNHLNPKPGSGYEFSEYENQSVQPDVYVIKRGDDYDVVLNFDEMPFLRINRSYERMLKDKNCDPQVKSYLQEKIKSAYWFIKSIQQRGSTILTVAKEIVERQKEFLDKGPSYMKPLTLKDIAYSLNLHESTISRVTSNKYIMTPQGLFEMKYFFSGGIRKIGVEDVSTTSVKELIKDIINQESPNKPLSDQEISDILKSKGYCIARRTVTKYRESMGILSSSMRKK
ncbi:MAG: RNA polymerase factor sigma-54 [Proteobacteria bacterium]|nr:RNA polymerase factor sigma-54 [Pseudomonadota bacterium]